MLYPIELCVPKEARIYKSRMAGARVISLGVGFQVPVALNEEGLPKQEAREQGFLNGPAQPSCPTCSRGLSQGRLDGLSPGVRSGEVRCGCSQRDGLVTDKISAQRMNVCAP